MLLQAITFHKCQNLKVKNITFFNSQQMHLAFTSCKHVSASGVNIIAPSDSPNTDGIHISASTDVELKNIAIRTGLLFIENEIKLFSLSINVSIQNEFLPFICALICNIVDVGYTCSMVLYFYPSYVPFFLKIVLFLSNNPMKIHISLFPLPLRKFLD